MKKQVKDNKDVRTSVLVEETSEPLNFEEYVLHLIKGGLDYYSGLSTSVLIPLFFHLDRDGWRVSPGSLIRLDHPGTEQEAVGQAIADYKSTRPSYTG